MPPLGMLPLGKPQASPLWPLVNVTKPPDSTRRTGTPLSGWCASGASAMD